MIYPILVIKAFENIVEVLGASTSVTYLIRLQFLDLRVSSLRKLLFLSVCL